MAKFLRCGSLKKWIFEKFLETTKVIGFIMLSVYVAYSASMMCVQCGSLEKSIFNSFSRQFKP